MKRTRQLEEVISMTNRYLRLNHIKDESNPAFHVLMDALLETGTYKGFNYFNDMQIGDETVPVLAGSSIEYEYLQLY